MLQVTLGGNLVTPDPNNYYSINIERSEVAHMVKGVMVGYIRYLTNKTLQEFIKYNNFDKIEEYYNTFEEKTY